MKNGDKRYFKQMIWGVFIFITIFLLLLLILVKTSPTMSPKFKSFGESPIVNQRIINLENSKK